MPDRWMPRPRMYGNGQPQRPGHRAGQPRPRRAFAVAAVLAGLSGCDLAPAYDPPQHVLPANWRGQGPFTVASPGDTLQRGPWSGTPPPGRRPLMANGMPGKAPFPWGGFTAACCTDLAARL